MNYTNYKPNGDGTISPLVEKPILTDSVYSMSETEKDAVLKQSEVYLESLKVKIPFDGKLPDKEVLLLGKDFNFQYQRNILIDETTPAWKDISEEQFNKTTTQRRIIAVPIEPIEEREDELWLNIFNDGWYGIESSNYEQSIHRVKQHYKLSKL